MGGVGVEEGAVHLAGGRGGLRTCVHQLGEFQAQALFDFAHFAIHGEGLDV